MSDPVQSSSSGKLTLPERPNLDWLRKQAKHLLDELRKDDPGTQLAAAQFRLAKSYGFSSWRALVAHVKSLTLEGQLFDSARAGDLPRLTALLDAHPDKLLVRDKPYGHTLLHEAARHGQLDVVDLLLARGVDVNVREPGDDTYAMHWAAAGAHLDVVRRLANAGGDVVGHGDDHELEVIGWASCWEECDDPAHRAVVDFLVSRGAQHHIFSAIAVRLPDEVRRIVAADPSAVNKRMSRNESHQTPLHFAVRMKRVEMIPLLLDLGTDPRALDDAGQSAAFYAQSPDVDRQIMERIHSLTVRDLATEHRAGSPPHAEAMDLAAALSLGDWSSARQLVRENPSLLDRGGGVLHLMAKRNDARAARWLLDQGVDPNARWTVYESEATALHMAAGAGNTETVRLLLDAGADPRIRDTRFDSDSIGWAEHFGETEALDLLRRHTGTP